MVQFDEGNLPIHIESDIVACRKVIRDQCTAMGFGITDVTRIVTAVSELARNVYVHAKTGEMHWKTIQQIGKMGVEIIFTDSGPGIPDIEQAMMPGFTTANSMGMGLPGVKKLMDELYVEAGTEIGTKVTIRKWTRAR